MRARNIKPSITKNEDLADLPYEARLLFLMLPMMADWEGRLEDRPRRIKAELFPYDNDLDVCGLLSELTRNDFLERYEIENVGKFIWIKTFSIHQNPHKDERNKPSEIPPYDPKYSNYLKIGTASEQPPNHLRGNRADSLNLIPESPSLIPDPSKSEPPPDPVFDTLKKPGDDIDVTISPRIIEEFTKRIKFAPKNAKNLYHIDTSVKSGLSELDLMKAMELAQKKYETQSTAETFRKGIQTFFDPDHIRHVLSDKFEICPPSQVRSSDQTPGENWLQEKVKELSEMTKNTQLPPSDKLNRKDALQLLTAYIERWRYGLKQDLAERWLKSLIGQQKTAILKAFDLLIKKSEKPFTYEKLMELSRNYSKKNGALDDVKRWREESEGNKDE